MVPLLLCCVRAGIGWLSISVPPPMWIPLGTQQRAERNKSEIILNVDSSHSGVLLTCPTASPALAQLGLFLHSWGRPGFMVGAEQVPPVESSHGIEYSRPGLVEWYLESPFGIEHGFTILERPPGSGSIHLRMETTGTFVPRMCSSGDIQFTSPTSHHSLLYSGLIVRDSQDRLLNSNLRLVRKNLTIIIEDSGAAYPIYVDPWITLETNQLQSPTPQTADIFGLSVGIENNTIIVGRPTWGLEAGSAHFFERNGASWAATQEVSGTLGFFGFSVALDGVTAIIGEPTNKGLASVYSSDGSQWNLQQVLQMSNGKAQDVFGTSVALWGDTAVVGAPEDDTQAGIDAGSAVVFVRSGSSWSQQAKLKAGDADPNDFMGLAVSIWDDTVAVGAPFHGGGRVYVFVRTGSTWIQEAELAPQPGTGGLFGNSVAVFGDSILVGAPEGKPVFLATGSAHVFSRSAGIWTEQQVLTASNPGSVDRFGTSVSLEADVALIGADGFDSNAGTAYLFDRSGSFWTERLQLSAAGVLPGDAFGYSIDHTDGVVVIGAWGDDSGPLIDSGAAYVFNYYPPFSNYCTAGVSSSGCSASLSGSGTPSASAPSAFVLAAFNVEGGRSGLFFYGTNGRQALPWGNGSSFQCVVPPVKRGGLLIGTGTTNACDGSFALDLNARWCPTCPKPNHNPGAGAVVQAQLWYRDPLNTSNQTTSTSDAIEFAVGP